MLLSKALKVRTLLRTTQKKSRLKELSSFQQAILSLSISELTDMFLSAREIVPVKAINKDAKDQGSNGDNCENIC